MAKVRAFFGAQTYAARLTVAPRPHINVLESWWSLLYVEGSVGRVLSLGGAA